ncbi:Cytochrome P450 94B1 [Camellia lanceoleosa]|uniref:Cytochrome P450 94B1 n=1 Tax=Camellia lanceoleosa TaxID=1840588 RepID=A0ACC0FUK6_9ERIC|nr:Cytochrome P450 94B1 [Camellia lanceoleosa]
MLDLELSTSFLFCILSLLFLFIINSKSIFTTFFPSTSKSSKIPRSYPFIGSFLAFHSNRQRVIQWTSDAVTSTPTSTFVLNRPLGRCQVITVNPSNVQHILKTHSISTKRPLSFEHMSQTYSAMVSLMTTVRTGSSRDKLLAMNSTPNLYVNLSRPLPSFELLLIPFLSSATANKTVLDLQDILQRFAFDNICKIAFGYDLAYLLPSLPQEKFTVAFDTAARISEERFRAFHPLFWKTKRFLDIGSEKQLRISANEVREFAKEIVKEKKQELAASFEKVKDMIYTHASLSESMRLYPPVPVDGKQAVDDDVLLDGMVIKKGMRVSYHPYAMGRSEKLWGSNWAEFRPERWLEMRAAAAGKWSFVARDPYTYPVFQAGPRICLEKDMAFLQMKRVVSGVLRRFKVVPAFEEGVKPVFMAHLTSKMKGGFPVRIEERAESF